MRSKETTLVPPLVLFNRIGSNLHAKSASQVKTFKMADVIEVRATKRDFRPYELGRALNSLSHEAAKQQELDWLKLSKKY